ncbi:MAG: alpha/beta hydrolase [Saprospiraceae bacterium]|nr:alpha/beta hydrolase [Saprospiraceae bacterium]
MKTFVLKRFLKRMCYLIGALLVIWIIAVQAGCLSMRTSDQAWRKKLLDAGQATPPQFIDVSSNIGRTIHAVIISRSDSLPWIVMVHGSPGSSDAFLPYLSDTNLSNVANMISLDRPGFGYTSGFGKPEPSQKAQAAAVKAVVDRLSPGKKVILVGHSLGAPVIAQFAMDYPESTAALVLAGASIDPALEEHPWWQKAVDVAPLRWLTPKSLWTSNAEIIPLEQELEHMRQHWAEITCPVRVVHAENDRLVPFGNVDFARRMLTNCSDFQAITFAKGDHFFIWTDTGILKEVMISLLKYGRQLN